MSSGSKALAIVLLLVGLVLANYLATSVPARYDATSEKIYTLSPGTKALLAKITEPTTLDLYFSRNTSGQFVEYKNYAERVREMLRQYVRASKGKIRLNVIDPEPDTPQEEKATAAGIEPQTIPGGSQFYFGLVATQAEQQKVIGALNPQREQFLEYDVSELIYGVGQTEKKKLGLITSLPLQGSAGMPMMGQQGTEGQYVVNEWEDTYQIVPVEASATELPAGLDVLAVIHPENLAPRLQFAIDQFLLAGKPVFLAVDPSSLYFKRQGGQAAMFGGPQPNVSSDLPVLLGGWGIAYDPQKVVGDLENAEEVQLRDESRVRYPVWINLTQEDFNAKALPTAQLGSALFVEAGSVALKPGTELTFTPLVETSPKSGEIPVAALPLRLEPQLPARSRDVVALFAPQGHRHPRPLEDVRERQLPDHLGPLPGKALHGVVRDQVHVRVQVERDVAEPSRLVHGVVHPLDEDELERDHPSMALAEGPDRGQQLCQRVGLVDRHDPGPDLVGRPVERDRQPEAQRLVGKPDYLGDQAARGDRDAARAEPEAPVCIHDGEGPDERVVVRERLTHPHDDDVVERGQLRARARRPRVLGIAHLEELGDDLPGAQVPLEPFKAACAEHAPHRASHLRGDADRLARVVDADAILGRADDDRLDERAVLQLEEELVRHVGRVPVEDKRRGHERECRVKP